MRFERDASKWHPSAAWDGDMWGGGASCEAVVQHLLPRSERRLCTASTARGGVLRTHGSGSSDSPRQATYSSVAWTSTYRGHEAGHARFHRMRANMLISPEHESARVGTGGGVAYRGLAAQCRPRRRCGCKGIGCFRLSTATETRCRRHTTVVLGSRHAAWLFPARLSRFIATAACGVDNVPRSHSASPECQISNSYHLDLSDLNTTCSAPLRSSRWHSPLSSSRSGAHERWKPPCGLQVATSRWFAAHVGGCHAHPRGAAVLES